MKIGLLLLGLIGLASALGSGISPDTFFYTLPFRLLLLLLFINMTLCTINQISKLIKVFRNKRTNNVFRFRQFSLLILHLGIVLILIGGTINTYQGESKQIRLIAGDTIDIADVISTEESFYLQLNEFKIEFYEDGSPSQYISDVDIIDKNTHLHNYLISVNHPLKYAGIKAYQHSYGYMINVEYEDNQDSHNHLLAEGQVIHFNDTNRIVRIYKYIPNFDARYGMNTKTIRPDNPKIVYSVYENNEMLGIGAADIGEKVQIDDNVFLTFKDVQLYTVLCIKSDPGLIWATIGGILLMVGVCLAFYFAGRKKSKSIKQEMRNQ
ncbi:MAG: cytochrome c biogenesis protein ResB [Syntrophomonadaceae bacterium]|nr:cytochrome c biogenesis protein ResB [Syntrophomonadaceae bacterium]